MMKAPKQENSWRIQAVHSNFNVPNLATQPLVTSYSWDYILPFVPLPRKYDDYDQSEANWLSDPHPVAPGTPHNQQYNWSSSVTMPIIFTPVQDPVWSCILPNKNHLVTQRPDWKFAFWMKVPKMMVSRLCGPCVLLGICCDAFLIVE